MIESKWQANGISFVKVDSQVYALVSDITKMLDKSIEILKKSKESIPPISPKDSVIIGRIPRRFAKLANKKLGENL